MTWWIWAVVGMAATLVIVREVRWYRRHIRPGNYSRSVSEDQKKGPPQHEARTGIEYGGHHLP